MSKISNKILCYFIRYYPVALAQYIQQTCIVFRNQIYPLLMKEMSFKVKHCKTEIEVLSMSAKVAKLKKTYS